MMRRFLFIVVVLAVFAGVSAHRVSADPATCQGEQATLTSADGTPNGQGGYDIQGTDGPDVIVGTDGSDTINGNGGDDLICSGDGADTVSGGDGNDQIYMGDGGDISGFTRACGPGALAAGAPT